MMTLARCFTSPPYVRTESSSFSVRTTAAVFFHSWPHGGFTRRLRDFNALQGNLQFGTGKVYSANGMTKPSITINCGALSANSGKIVRIYITSYNSFGIHGRPNRTATRLAGNHRSAGQGRHARGLPRDTRLGRSVA